jgi:hypothetical protein
MAKKEFDFESDMVSPTDAMGREIWWEDAGRPEGGNQ